MGSSSSKPTGRKLAQTVTSQIKPSGGGGGGAPSAAAGAASANRGRLADPSSPPAGSPAARRPDERASNAAAFQAHQLSEGVGPKAYGYDRRSASEIKTKEILEDAGDPTLLQNLQRLGPVAVEHPNSPLDARRNEQQNSMYKILAARAKDAQQEDGLFGAADADPYTSASSQPNPTSTSAAPLRLSPSTIATLLDERKDCTSRADMERLAFEYDVPVELIEVLGRYVNTPSVSESRSRIRLQTEDDENGPPLVYAVWQDPKLEDAPKQISS